MASNIITVFNINILQWNARSLRPKLSDLELTLNRYNIHIAALSETWLEPDTDLRLTGYNIFRNNRYDFYGGVAVLCHRSVKAFACPIYVGNTGIEIIHVRISNCKLLQNVVSIYCPNSVYTQQSDWHSIYSEFTKKSLILGDFNGHHVSWSNKTDSRGNQLFDSTLDNYCISFNDGRCTRINLVDGIAQQTSPDVSFCTTDISINMKWNITDESLGSDHLIILMNLQYQDNKHII
jgi:hypothetical protein